MKFYFLLFLLTLSAFSQVNEGISQFIVREGSRKSQTSPSQIEMKLSSGDIESFNILFREQGLLISYYDSLGNSKGIHKLHDIPEFIDSYYLTHDEFPLHHDYNSDGYKDYALHFSHQSRGDEFIFMIFNPKTKKYELADAGFAHKSFTFERSTNLLIFMDWQNTDEFGFVSSIHYMLCIGNKWQEIGQLESSNYFGRFDVLRNGIKTKIHLNRNSWIRSHGFYRIEKRSVVEASEWSQQNLLKYWLPSEAEAELIAKSILYKEQLPKLLIHLSKQSIQMIFLQLLSMGVSEELKSKFEAFTHKNREVILPKYLYHKVKKEETLFSISKFYKLPISRLRELNHISKSNIIYAGEELILPAQSKP
ncbi:MAG: LysM domain-containing protein [Lentisphaeraceae bacterium]|nr:LysM domain-containing protein [Lentisphaeraceae bacterium]